MPEALYPWMHLIGRIFFSTIFIMFGMTHLMKVNDLAGMAQARKVPAPKAAVVVTGLMILAGGVSVLLGWRPFIGAGLIAVFTFLTATVMHPFWKETDPMAKMNEMTHFWKDLALCGAALLIAFYAAESWPMSLGG